MKRNTINELLMLQNNVISTLSKRFALRIIRLYKYLTEEKREYVMARQVYRSGTSIGANIAESKNAQSPADFINKLSIALKEADETQYWLELLYESKTIDDNEFESLSNDLKTIIGTLINIINKIKAKNQK
ncbi:MULTISPECIES: four helix bundle protein [Hoylesella]|uniref:Four helix bundle protein n=1 Tax=Hoylesella pleuritidis F0068 TaxID=1081904 RepID=U2L8K3_9BACT|nr:four helix bundle protein [Hoylesella pleuritidis F0068]